jgi:Ca2+-binding RTX toxin-like protein
MDPRRAALALSLVLAALCALPAAAAAIPIPGENGRIVFASGRNGPDLNDNGSLLYLQPVTFSNSGGLVSPPIVPPGGQYRHPTWSPDRTKIAFANGTPASGMTEENFDIFVIDLVNGGGPIQITPTDDLSADRPAWSPDGTRLAFEHQPVNNNADRIIQVQSTSDLTPPISTTPINLTDADGGAEGKPDWSPNSGTIYYSHLDGADRDILREAADNSTVTPTTVLGAGADGVDQYQPAISPLGNEMCYTETGTGDVKKVSLPVAGAPVTINADVGSQYNCTWSPDGDKIAYVTGATTAGAMVMEESSGLQAFPDGLTDDANNFDGNPSWAPDGRPVCADRTVTTPAGQAVTFDVECIDTGPAYEQSNVRDFNATEPANGTLAPQDLADDPYTYTPNAGFTGTDSFVVQSFDEFGFGPDTGTVTIQVTGGDGPPPPPGARCFRQDATIVGTAGNDEIVGTPGDDIIATLAGSDSVSGGGGNDIICGGPQDDRLAGGAGRDRVGGGNGNDRVGGGGGNDRLAGNAGRDRVAGGGGRDSLSGGGQNDRLGGGPGRDRLRGAQGRDRLRGGGGPDRLGGGGGPDRLNGGAGPDRCAGNAGIDSARACELITGIP